MAKIVQFRQAVADVIRSRRTLAGLTQSQLAKRIGGSEIGVRTWERAASGPSLETFLLLAAALGVDARELLAEVLSRMAFLQNRDG